MDLILDMCLHQCDTVAGRPVTTADSPVPAHLLPLHLCVCERPLKQSADRHPQVVALHTVLRCPG